MNRIDHSDKEMWDAISPKKEYRIRFYKGHEQYHLQVKVKFLFFKFWWSLESSPNLKDMETEYKNYKSLK